MCIRDSIYWMNVHFWYDTCAVAELDGELVGWCSIIPLPGGKYFLHQLGVAPSAQRLGLAQSLLAYLVNKLIKNHSAVFKLEFTIDRTNRAALNLFRAVADAKGMHLLKRPEPVELIEEGTGEELYK